MRVNTGGGCDVYYGQLEDGRYFAFSDDVFFFTKTDYGYVFTTEFFEETEGDTTEWEKKNVIKAYYAEDGYPDDVKEIIRREKSCTKF